MCGIKLAVRMYMVVGVKLNILCLREWVWHRGVRLTKCSPTEKTAMFGKLSEDHR